MKTVSERARVRATQSRLRAVVQHTPSGIRYYRVYNLNAGRRYVVTERNGVWVCHCEAAKAGTRCKHVQRVMDREEKRTKQEALREGT